MKEAGTYKQVVPLVYNFTPEYYEQASQWGRDEHEKTDLFRCVCID